jgi:hypothetical protein
MAGSIRTSEKCPRCRQAFASIPHPIIPKEQVDLVCPACLTRPVKVWIDARGIRDRRGEAIGNIPKGANGEPFLSFHAAHLVLSTIRQQKKDGTLDARDWQPERTKKYLLPDLGDEYVSALQRGGRGRGHVTQVELVLGILKGVLGNRDCRTIGGGDLEAMDKGFVEAGHGGRTRQKYLYIVQAFVRWMNKYHLSLKQRIEVPPLPIIKVERAEIGWIDTPEQLAGLDAIEFPELRTAYLTLFATGMRIGEVCGLKKRDLIEVDGLPHAYVQRSVTGYGKVKETKTGSWMLKPIPRELWDQLRRESEKKFPEDFLWKTRYGNPYNPNRLSIVWHEASVKVGLNISLYAACRHSKATREMMDLQKQMYAKVGKVLGDTPRIARGYVRPMEERRRVKNVSEPSGSS